MGEAACLRHCSEGAGLPGGGWVGSEHEVRLTRTQLLAQTSDCEQGRVVWGLRKLPITERNQSKWEGAMRWFSR